MEGSNEPSGHLGVLVRGSGCRSAGHTVPLEPTRHAVPFGLAPLGKTGTWALSVIGANQFALSTAALPPPAEKQALLKGALRCS